MEAWYDGRLEEQARAYDRSQALLFVLRFALMFGLAVAFWMSGFSRLLADGHSVVGIDNCNDYYDVQLKKDRLAQLAALPQAERFCFELLDLADGPGMAALFARVEGNSRSKEFC